MNAKEIASSMVGSADPKADMLRFIIAFGETNGYLPYYDEIAEGISLLQGKERTSRSLVAYYMKQLEQSGELTIWRGKNGRMIPGRYVIHGARWVYQSL